MRNPGGVPWRGCAAVCLRQLGDGDRARQFALEELEDARAWGAPRTVAQGLRYVALGEPPTSLPSFWTSRWRCLAPSRRHALTMRSTASRWD